MTEEQSTVRPEWEVLTMSMAASFVNNSEDSTRQKFFQYPILEGCPDSDKVEWINPLHGSSSGDVSEKIVELPPSIPVDLRACDYGEEDALDLFPGSSNLEKVASKVEVDALSTVFAEIVGTDGQAIQVKPRRSKGSKAVWTIAIAATVVGISMLAHRLQVELQQNQQLQLEILSKDEKLDDVLHQISRLKEVLTNHFNARSSSL